MDNNNRPAPPQPDLSTPVGPPAGTANVDAISSDALSMSSANTAVSSSTGSSPAAKKRLSTNLRKYSHRFNIYLLLFLLILVIAGAVLVVTVLSSKGVTSDHAAIDSQSLSDDTLNQLNSTNTTIGDPKQILNVQSNTVFAGKVLVRDNLDVAGTIRVGGSLSLPGITVSGDSNFDQLNVNRSLNIGGDASIQGQINIRKNLAVSGNGTFGGPVSAPQISTSSLQLVGDLTLTKHVIVGGPAPGRSVGSAVGLGGTASVSGSDTAGSININTGGSAAAGCFLTVNFSQRYGNTPHIQLTPVGAEAGALSYYVTRTAASFSVCTANVPASNASFGFDYFVSG